MNNREKGKNGEGEAVRYLQEKGWRILEKNYQNRYGEVDLIAKDGEVLVFIEVKSWNRFRYEDLEYAIDRRKRNRIIGVARYYLERVHRAGGTDIRFDVVFHDPGNNSFEHIENAFTETGKL